MSGELLLRFPEAALLLIPALTVYIAVLRRGPGRWLRLVVLLLVVLAAVDPELALERGGSDVIVVLDRSASMGAARDEQAELLELVAAQRGADDRLGVVAFAAGAVLAQAPQPEGTPRPADVVVGGHASDLAAGLEHAHSLIPRGRSGRVLVHSDGEYTDLGPGRASSALALANVPVDVLPVRRPPLPDAAVQAVELPDALASGESFIGTVTLVGDQVGRRPYRVVRGSHVVAQGVAALEPGRPTAVRFADRPPEIGIVGYEVELDVVDDRRPANNRARAALRVVGGERVLVLGGAGGAGNIARAVEATGLEVVTRPEGPVSHALLAGFRALVLEQVPADALKLDGMRAIAAWVEHLGGGLVMTGGRRSFGGGGYHRSPVEAVLPVTMEIRDEHRKLNVALAISLDRSGSMSATVTGGRSKMQLANAGAVAAIELLGPSDQVAVHAVDSAPHVIVPLTAVDDRAGLIGQVRGIRAEGGGIYVYEALQAAGAELLKATAGTRHLVLFADASDAEEPGAYQTLVGDLAAAGVTVSVIGLGTRADVDASLLADIAARGGGRLYFADRAADLPRLFAQETLLVSRSTWVDERVRLAPQPLLATTIGPGAALDGAWPAIPGYNLSYARPRANVLVQAPGDPSAPAVAAWHVGSGRSVAVPFALDDPESAELLAWPGYAPLVGSLVRWATGGTDAAAIGALAAVRTGRSVTVTLELDPARRAAWPAAAPELVLVRPGHHAGPLERPLEPIDAGRYEAVVQLVDERPVLTAARLGGGVSVVGPVLQLPYSPEAEPRFGRAPGPVVLARIADVSGGRERDDVIGVFDNPPSPGRLQSVAPYLVVLALVLALLEIAVRRFRLTLRRPRRRQERGRAAAAPAPTPAPEEAVPPAGAAPDEGPPEAGLHEALRELRRRRRR